MNYIKESDGVYMAQPTYVMSFRKRLSKRGYTNISIIFNRQKNLYLVSAIEPLSLSVVFVEGDEDFFCRMFR